MHEQAVVALARRRVNVLWAMLRDRTTYREDASGCLTTASGYSGE